MLDKHSCEMFYTQKLPSKVSQGDTKMRVDLHHGMYGVISTSVLKLMVLFRCMKFKMPGTGEIKVKCFINIFTRDVTGDILAGI